MCKFMHALYKNYKYQYFGHKKFYWNKYFFLKILLQKVVGNYFHAIFCFQMNIFIKIFFLILPLIFFN